MRCILFLRLTFEKYRKLKKAYFQYIKLEIVNGRDWSTSSATYFVVSNGISCNQNKLKKNQTSKIKEQKNEQHGNIKAR